jgi:hypothetical protein
LSAYPHHLFTDTGLWIAIGVALRGRPAVLLYSFGLLRNAVQ